MANFDIFDSAYKAQTTNKNRDFYVPLSEMVRMACRKRYIFLDDLAIMSGMTPEKGSEKLGYHFQTVLDIADSYKKFVYFQGKVIMPHPRKIPLYYRGGRKLWRSMCQITINLKNRSKKKEKK